jgi:hypothetical protein
MKHHTWLHLVLGWIVIQPNGTVIFNEGEQSEQISVSAEEVELLRQFILQRDFFTLSENYEGSGDDFIAHTITVTIGDKTHTVYCYNDCPPAFDELVEKIKSLWPEPIEYYGWS